MTQKTHSTILRPGDGHVTLPIRPLSQRWLLLIVGGLMASAM